MKRSHSTNQLFLSFNLNNILFFLGASVAQKCVRPKSSGFKMRADAPGRPHPNNLNLVFDSKTNKTVKSNVLNIRKFEILNLFSSSALPVTSLPDTRKKAGRFQRFQHERTIPIYSRFLRLGVGLPRGHPGSPVSPSRFRDDEGSCTQLTYFD